MSNTLKDGMNQNRHFVELRLSTTGDLLCAQSTKLLLKLDQLLLQIILTLAPKPASLDFAGRLHIGSVQSYEGHVSELTILSLCICLMS